MQSIFDDVIRGRMNLQMCTLYLYEQVLPMSDFLILAIKYSELNFEDMDTLLISGGSHYFQVRKLHRQIGGG